jgi:Polyphosphate kinase 2 (PPK2)
MTMKISSKDFRVREGDEVNLKKWPTIIEGADRPRASRDPSQRTDPGFCAARQEGRARPLSFDRRFGEAPPRQRHPHHQVLPPSVEERAAEAISGAHRRPEKNWKFSLADIEERKFWKDYRKAYEECLGATSTSVVLADDKENARLIVSQIVLDTFEGLKMAYPKTTAKRHEELLWIREQLAK